MDRDLIRTDVETAAREFGADGGHILRMDRSPWPIRTPFPPGCHVHESWELRVCRGGNYVLETPHGKIVIPPRCLLLIPPGTVHLPHRLSRANQSSRVRCLYVTLTRDSLTVGVQNKAFNVYRLLSFEQCAAVCDLTFDQLAVQLDKIAAMMESSTQARQRTLCINRLRLFFSILAEILAHPDAETLPPPEGAAVKALNFLKIHYYQPQLSLGDVARHVGLAPTYLSGLFRKFHNRSLRQTLIDLRLEQARALLQQHTYSVKEVAHLTGWSNQLYFSKVYRRKFGYPPSHVLRITNRAAP